MNRNERGVPSPAPARVAQNRRSGGRDGMRRGGGGAPAWTPLTSPKGVEVWLSYAGTTDDGAGLISAWAGQKTGKIFTAATTARPTLTASRFGSQPGLVFDGTTDTMVCSTVGALISGNAGLSVIMVYYSATTAVRVFLEYGSDNVASAGEFSFVANNVNLGTVYVVARGNIGLTDFYGGVGSAPMTNAGVLAATVDFSLATNEVSYSLDGVPISGSRANNSNNTSTFADKPLHLGARNGTLFTPMTLAAVAVYSTLTSAELLTEARGLGSIFGVVVA